MHQMSGHRTGVDACCPARVRVVVSTVRSESDNPPVRDIVAYKLWTAPATVGKVTIIVKMKVIYVKFRQSGPAAL
jgi:hypothetical protein